MANILIIDDDKMICDSLTRVFRDMGHEVSYALTFREGLEIAESEQADLVFLDVRLPDGDGIRNMSAIQTVSSSPEVIIITGYADPDSAEIAIRHNAWNYIRKPASIDALMLGVSSALQYRAEKNVSKSAATLKRLKRDGIVGESPEILKCLDIVALSAGSSANVLITGETGTGKELFARAIHANSARSENRFVVIDCASLPETLIENMLFGHGKGAFTGADKAEDGLIKCADRGTLFFDEIGELPMTTQATLLRVFQERRFRPLGKTQEIKSDFRLVSASNRNLDEMVKSNRFRDDLLFRLRTVTIPLPPLRDHAEDIRELVIHCLTRLCKSQNIGMKDFSPDFLEMLTSYDWPGNIRELLSALELAVVQAFNEPTLFPKHIPPHIRIQTARYSLGEETHHELKEEKNSPKKILKWKEFRKALIAEGEERYLHDLILETGGNIKKASQLSELSQPRLYELLRKYEISTR